MALDDGASRNRDEFLPGLARFKRFALPAAGLGIAAIGFVVLERLVQEVSLDEIRSAAAAMPVSLLLAATALTALSFAAVALYDLVAVETVAPGRVARHVALLAGAAGYAISNALGFAILTGGALRYRIYAAEGVPLPDIGRIVGTSWLAIWFAFAALFGAILVVEPGDLPWLRGLPASLEVALGLAVLGAIVAFVTWVSVRERTVAIGRISMKMPGASGALLQIAAGVVDVCAAAATLYILLPAHVDVGPAAFLLVYIVATVIGIASHSPGGLGAFEATMIAGLGLGSDAEAIAALLVYRAVYTLLPFLVAVGGMVVSEIVRHRTHVGRGVRTAARVMEPLVPPLAAGVTFLGGLLLLVSTVTPAAEGRIERLSAVVPLPFIEVSHLAASIAGLAMLIVARGLARRLARAWLAALVLFGLGAVLSLLKGLDWEEATVLTVLCGVLFVFRESFYRSPIEGLFRVTWGWLASTGALVFSVIWLGFFAYRHVEYANDLWWQFALEADAPRFLRATVVLVVALLVVALTLVVNRRGRAGQIQPPDAIIRKLVGDSPDTTAALALLGDKRFLVDPEGRGFVMYAHSGGSLVAMGEPIASGETARELAWAFRDLADREAARTVFYEVGPENLPLYLDMGLVALKLGEVARVDLSTFSLEGAKRQPLRYAARRIEKDGLAFEILPAASVPPLLPALRKVSDEWLRLKAGREKGFSLGYFDEAYMANFDLAVLRRDGEIVAFANLWRGAGRKEITVDLMRHAADAPNYLMDALFARLMLAAQAGGYRWFNLGAAPLSGLSDSRLASRWQRFGSFLYRRGAQFYRFDGLRAYKDKFGPVWTPHYLICPPGLDTVRALIDVTTLVSGGPLEFARK